MTNDKSLPPTLAWSISLAVLTTIAAAVRWAACGESFWIDELHTAWCIDGSIGQVAPRAAAGNQQPVFFAGLWVWNAISQHLFFWLPVEPRLRLPIVAASAASVILLADMVRRITSNSVAAWMIGLAASLEVNHVFYGTELRPYAIVDLAIAAMLWLATSNLRHRRTAMHLIGTMAVLCHVTALPIVALILIIELALEPHRWIATVCLASLLWSLVLAYLAWWILPDLWRDRGDWSTMSTPGSVWELLRVWPLAALVVVPAIAWIGWPKSPIDRRVVAWASVAGMVIVAAWAVSNRGTPLWHRRYLVGTLPPLWLLAGTWLGNSRWPFAGGVWVLAALAWQQGPYQWPMVERKENWRAAVAFVNQNAAPGEVVWIDPALIEQAAEPTPVGDLATKQYFAFAVRGPYRLAECLPLRLVGNRPIAAAWRGGWLISRRRAQAFPRDGVPTHFFGTVRVVGPVDGVSPGGT